MAESGQEYADRWVVHYGCGLDYDTKTFRDFAEAISFMEDTAIVHEVEMMQNMQYTIGISYSQKEE